MAFNLQSLRRANRARPPIILLHAPHGIGKTTLAASAPNPVFLPTEDGLWHNVPTFPRAESFEDVLSALESLYNDAHDFQPVVIDSLDWMEPMVWRKTCAINKWPSIEAPGYGKGYIAAADQWREYVDRITALRDDRNITVIQIAHSLVKRFESPETDPYDRYLVNLQDRASGLIQQHCDFVGFLNYRVSVVKTDAGFNRKVSRGVGGGVRVLYTEERPAFLAKNRFAMPEQIELPDVTGNDPALWAAVAQYFPQGE